MSEIRTIDGVVNLTTPPFSTTIGYAEPPQQVGVVVEDQVDLSDAALALGGASADQEIRAEKVAQIRAALARGDYLSEDKLDVAIQRAIESIEAKT